MSEIAIRTDKSLEDLCNETGLRMTKQRRVIVRVLESMSHPDVEQVHAQAARADKGISLATVYRTVRLLVEHGLLQQHNFNMMASSNTEMRARYESTRKEHHDHLIDVENGRVLEFTNEAIEKLQEQVAKKMGYQLVAHRLELYAIPLKTKSGRSKAGRKTVTKRGQHTGKSS